MATKKKVPVPTVLDRILAQQKKAATRKIAPAREARLLVNGKTLAIGLYEDGIEIHYCPAAIAKPDPYTHMQQWVQSGKGAVNGEVLTRKRGK